MINLVIPTLILSTISLVISIVAIIMVVATKLSTHKIEWKPLNLHDPLENSESEVMFKTEEDEKILSEVLEMQRTGKKKKKDEDPLDAISETNNF